MASPPDSQTLRAFADEHLWYEIWMLAAITQRLLRVLEHDKQAGGRDLAWLDMETRNAQVESFTIHARALLDFFYATERRKPDDALASDFLDEGDQWAPPPMTPALEHVNARVGKEIAHLTYTRLAVANEAKNWDYLRIWLDLASVIKSFIDQAAFAAKLPPGVVIKVKALFPEDPRLEAAQGASATHGATAVSGWPET